jgi:hypothetical protein
MALSSLSGAGALYRRVLAHQSYPSGWAERSPVDQSNSNGSRGKHVGSAAGPARLLISIATRFRGMPGSPERREIFYQFMIATLCICWVNYRDDRPKQFTVRGKN